MMKQARTIRLLVGAMAAFALAGCGGGENVKIGGTLSGLGTDLTVVLQNNGSDDLSLTSNGEFSFDETVSSPDGYDVTVRTQPVGQTCTVANGSGSVDLNDAKIDDIKVTCKTTSSLGGTISGLAAGTSVTLQNGDTKLVLTSDGDFAFPGVLSAGTAYSVTIAVAPAGQTCTVSSPSGTIVADTIAKVTVSCS
jgi:hypothetical protein